MAGAVRLMLFEAREARKLVADLDGTVPAGKYLACVPPFGVSAAAYSLGSKKNPYSPSYTTGMFLYSAASSGVNWI